MSRSKARSPHKTSRILVYGVPLIAVILVGAVFALNLSRSPLQACNSPAAQTPAMDFNVSLSIQVQNFQGNESKFILSPGVGIPGGIWASHALDKYGTDGRSPVCTDRPNTSGTYRGYDVIHVRSTVNRNYTLGDYFAVWGQPIGPNATLNQNYVLQEKGYQWQICIGNPTDTTNIKPGHWGNETLVSGKFITLMYFPMNGNGCLGYG